MLKRMMVNALIFVFISAAFPPAIMAEGDFGEENTAVEAAEQSALPEDVKVVIDGEYQEYDTSPFIKNDRVLVPLRGVFEALGAAVTWNGEKQEILAIKNETLITLTVGSRTAYVGKVKNTLDQEPLLIEERTYIPIRFISEALNADVEWEAETKTVIIKTQIYAEPEIEEEEIKTQPTAESYKSGAELITEPGFENTSAMMGGWFDWNDSRISYVRDVVNSGDYAMRVSNRLSYISGAAYSTDEMIKAISANGSGTQYQIEANVKAAEGPMTLYLRLKLYTTAGEIKTLQTSAVVDKDKWTKLSNTGALTWTGELKRVVFYLDSVSTSQNSSQDFYVDDCSLKKLSE